MSRIMVLMILVIMSAASSAVAESYAPYIKIQTSSIAGAGGSSRDIGWAEVEFWDEGLTDDTYLGTVYSSSYGIAQYAFNMYLDSPDIYVKVRGKFPLPDNKFVRVRNKNSTSDLLYISTTWDDIDPGTIDLGKLHMPDNKMNIGTEARKCVVKMKSYYSGWTVPRDLIAFAKANGDGDTSTTDPLGKHINIVYEDYHNPGSGRAALSDINHETGHWIQFNIFPFSGEASPHSFTSEETEIFAFTEAWGDYVAYLTASLPDHKYQLPPDAEKWWRGGNNFTGVDNAGDIVEGAMWRALDQIDDPSGIFKVMVDDAALTIHAWLNGYGADKAWDIDSTFQALQNNGIVYTRGEFSSFSEVAPTNNSPADGGNVDLINGVTFIRGTITPVVVQSTKQDMNLSETAAIIPANKKRLGYKAVVAGLGENISPASWTFLADTPWANDIQFDTTSLPDGDYDLIIQAENGHGWWDNFDPDFDGDATASRDSDEKWLKSFKTWYNGDYSPDNDDEGKVIIDNTAPKISNQKPQ